MQLVHRWQFATPKFTAALRPVHRGNDESERGAFRTAAHEGKFPTRVFCQPMTNRQSHSATRAFLTPHWPKQGILHCLRQPRTGVAHHELGIIPDPARFERHHCSRC